MATETVAQSQAQDQNDVGEESSQTAKEIRSEPGAQEMRELENLIHHHDHLEAERNGLGTRNGRSVQHQGGKGHTLL